MLLAIGGGLVCLVAPAGGAATTVSASQQPAGGAATAQESGTVSWSVRPTPTEAQPERPNFAYDVKAGATVRDSIRIRNRGSQPLALTLYASDAVTTDSGALDLLPARQEPTDVGAWIALDSMNVEVPPNETVDVGFTMVVPKDADSGDHVGGIVSSYRRPGTDAEGRPVIVDRRLGSRVQVRVQGPLRPELSISDLRTDYEGNANPFGTGAMRVRYKVTNTGNVRLRADQVVSVGGRLGLPGREARLARMPELLPSDSLTFDVDVSGVWPTVRPKVAVDLQPIAAWSGDPIAEDLEAVSASTSTTAVPWLLVVLVAPVAGVPLVRWLRRRRAARAEAERARQATETAALVQAAVREALAARNGHGADADTGNGHGAANGTSKQSSNQVRAGAGAPAAPPSEPPAEEP